MKVSELTGAELDYWVAMALGIEEVKFHPVGPYENERARGYTYVDYVSAKGWLEFRPSRDWRDGGPLIEEKNIYIDQLSRNRNGSGWFAQVWNPYACSEGPTPLIAAMRALVASKYGDEVPDEI